ncbi:VOC family protein [Saccharopolyspora sp. ASAGF58]|uniref:VOC family protein n=1 Tax=Saccharopolyspora sp. ASAGF58 TaxID=2719023 RepID=UPI00143FD461|nr:VOC family protein [Saccharopolyspora sp. ASAGF58]QIZ37694.1 hypothetical protein FDZ84_27815 [Saccharopolyspora sp. ASAGF58]
MSDGNRGATDFDHTSIAVHDAPSWLRRLRGTLGATPLVGQVLPEFRYVVCQLGDEHSGGRLELMDAQPDETDGFLTRFLRRHGETAHHLTFLVPDVARTIEQVRELGLRVVKTDLTHTPWRETFLPPDDVHGVTIQLADSDVGYLPLRELLGTRTRDPARVPGNREGREPGWWEFAWDVPAGPLVRLRSTTLRSTDPAFSHRLFADVLDAETHPRHDGVEYRWPGGSLVVRPDTVAGISHLTVTGGPAPRYRIGATILVQEHT